MKLGAYNLRGVEPQISGEAADPQEICGCGAGLRACLTIQRLSP